jgi:hypothetical protein
MKSVPFIDPFFLYLLVLSLTHLCIGGIEGVETGRGKLTVKKECIRANTKTASLCLLSVATLLPLYVHAPSLHLLCILSAEWFDTPGFLCYTKMTEK